MKLTTSIANAHQIMGSDSRELRVMLVRLRCRPGPSAVFHRAAVVTRNRTYILIKGPQAANQSQATEGLLEETRSLLASSGNENARDALLLGLQGRNVLNTIILPPPLPLFPSHSGRFSCQKRLLNDNTSIVPWNRGEKSDVSTSRKDVDDTQTEDSQK